MISVHYEVYIGGGRGGSGVEWGCRLLVIIKNNILKNDFVLQHRDVLTFQKLACLSQLPPSYTAQINGAISYSY